MAFQFLWVAGAVEVLLLGQVDDHPLGFSGDLPFGRDRLQGGHAPLRAEGGALNEARLLARSAKDPLDSAYVCSESR